VPGLINEAGEIISPSKTSRYALSAGGNAWQGSGAGRLIARCNLDTLEMTADVSDGSIAAEIRCLRCVRSAPNNAT
jgi:hypothetical protein